MLWAVAFWDLHGWGLATVISESGFKLLVGRRGLRVAGDPYMGFGSAVGPV